MKYEYDKEIEECAQKHQLRLTKPPGSLGTLEQIAIQMAAFQGKERPSSRPCPVLLFAADHPVTRHGISPYPSEVTRAMLLNFEEGGAAASVLCRASELQLHVYDVGVNGRGDKQLPAGDIRCEDAMDEAVFVECIQLGKDAFKEHGAKQSLLILGEMGIGNSTVAAALCAWILGGADSDSLVGTGTGATGDLLSQKRAVVRDVLDRIRGESSARKVLQRAGGRELAALYGAMQAALSSRTLLLVDGFIVTAVAALLVTEEPSAMQGIIFAHRSDELGHSAVLKHLGATPILDLQMRLGEGSGALTAYPLVERACLLHNEMATFQSAAIPDKS